MSLLDELRNRASTLNRFFDATLPNVRAVSKSYRAQLPDDSDVQRPHPPDGTQPDWGTIGAAIDHRLRYAFTDDATPCYAVGMGMRRMERVVGTSKTAWAIGEVVHFLPLALRNLLADAQPAARSRPMLLSPEAEDQLCRICHALAWFEQVYRMRIPPPGNPLTASGPDLTVEAMVAAVPDYAVEDMAAQVERAEQPLADLRAQTTPSAVVNGPRFAGSKDVGNADADMIVGDLLIDVKATVNPKTIGREEFYQLLGYALLDYDDEYGIQRVGLYLSRSGALITWGLGEYLRLFGCTTPVDKVRRQVAEAFGRE